MQVYNFWNHQNFIFLFVYDLLACLQNIHHLNCLLTHYPNQNQKPKGHFYFFQYEIWDKHVQINFILLFDVLINLCDIYCFCKSKVNNLKFKVLCFLCLNKVHQRQTFPKFLVIIYSKLKLKRFNCRWFLSLFFVWKSFYNLKLAYFCF